MSLVEELQKLEGLRASGAITEDEFARAKARLLNETPATLVPDGAMAPRTTEGENPLQTFRRSMRDRWLGGICGALGQRTPIPSWGWRVGFVLLMLGFGIGLIPYILLWIFVPSE